MSDNNFTVYLCPPEYPVRFEPFRCNHPPVMHISDTTVRRTPSGGEIMVEHARCLACGSPVGTGMKRNIFVDIACLRTLDICAAGAMRRRIDAMHEIYLQRAEILFDEHGWRGDEEWRELAEIIDPHLTMRVVSAGAHGDGTRFLSVHIDEDYWPDRAPGQPAPLQGELPF